MNKYFESLIESLENIGMIENEISEAAKKVGDFLKSDKGRLIIISAGAFSAYINETIKSFRYLFKYDHSRIITIKSGEKYRELLNDESRKIENIKAVGVLDVMEMNVDNDDIVIALSATNSTEHIKYFMKQSHECGAYIINITSPSKGTFKKDYVDLPINLYIKNKTIKGLYIGNHTTILKVIIESIFFEAFKNVGQIVGGMILTTHTWTKKLRNSSFEVLRFFDEHLTNEQAIELLKESENELSVAILKKTKNISNEEAKAILERYKYNFNKIGIY